jgi:hypothetical protein
MTQAGVPVLLDLVAAGCKVKATGFGRVKLDVAKTLEQVARKNPNALVFGTDIPSTRAERPFMPSDIDLVEKVLGPDLAQKVFWDNPRARSTRSSRQRSRWSPDLGLVRNVFGIWRHIVAARLYIAARERVGERGVYSPTQDHGRRLALWQHRASQHSILRVQIDFS